MGNSDDRLRRGSVAQSDGRRHDSTPSIMSCDRQLGTHQENSVQIEDLLMVYRKCRGCNLTLDYGWYTNNQWSKGEGGSRCTDCVRDDIFHTPEYVCKECGREFTNQNNLNMLMQVHRPREFRCPVCGDVRFKSPANAVQHVESGNCRGCRGQENARQQIYDHVQRYAGGGGNPLLTNGWSQSSGVGGSVPDYPYQCQECAKSFRNLSQLMQHMDQKHSRMRMLGY